MKKLLNSFFWRPKTSSSGLRCSSLRWALNIWFSNFVREKENSTKNGGNVKLPIVSPNWNKIVVATILSTPVIFMKWLLNAFFRLQNSWASSYIKCGLCSSCISHFFSEYGQTFSFLHLLKQATCFIGETKLLVSFRPLNTRTFYLQKLN